MTAFAAILLASALSLVQPPMPASTEPEEIRALWDRATAALCAGDWEGYQELWARTDYIEVIHPDESDWRVGWEKIGPAYRELLDSGFRCEGATRSMRIHASPSGEMAWATAEVVIRTPDSKLERTLWQTLVFERISGVWRLVHGHASVPGQRQEPSP